MFIKVRRARDVCVLEWLTECSVFAIEEYQQEQTNQRNQKLDREGLAKPFGNLFLLKHTEEPLVVIL